MERFGDAEVELAAAINSLGNASLDSMFYRNLPGWLAALRLHNGHHDLYRDDCRKLLECASARPDPLIGFFVVWHCCAGPDAVDNPMVPVRVAEAALVAAKGSFRRMILAGSGAALYRAGRHEQAIARLEEAERDWDGDHSPLVAFLAMANQAHGRPAEARRWLDRLRNRTPITAADWNVPWDELEVRNLQQEAEAVVLLDPVFPADPFKQ